MKLACLVLLSSLAHSKTTKPNKFETCESSCAKLWLKPTGNMEDKGECVCGDAIEASDDLTFGTGHAGVTLPTTETVVFSHVIPSGSTGPRLFFSVSLFSIPFLFLFLFFLSLFRPFFLFPLLSLFCLSWHFSSVFAGLMNHFWSTCSPEAETDMIVRYYVDNETTASIQFRPPLASGVGFDDPTAPWGTKWFGLGAGNGGNGQAWFNNFKIPFTSSIQITVQVNPF